VKSLEGERQVQEGEVGKVKGERRGEERRRECRGGGLVRRGCIEKVE